MAGLFNYSIFIFLSLTGEDLVTCDNGLEILVADDICDGRVECNDGSDEIDCYGKYCVRRYPSDTSLILRMSEGVEVLR